MRKLFTLLTILMLAVSCQESDPQPSVSDTRWAAYDYTSDISGAEVYQVLYFRSSGTEVERYYAKEKTDIIGEPEVLTYTYDHPTLTITINDESFDGEMADGFIRLFGKDFEKL